MTVDQSFPTFAKADVCLQLEWSDSRVQITHEGVDVFRLDSGPLDEPAFSWDKESFEEIVQAFLHVHGPIEAKVE